MRCINVEGDIRQASLLDAGDYCLDVIHSLVDQGNGVDSLLDLLLKEGEIGLGIEFGNPMIVYFVVEGFQLLGCDLHPFVDLVPEVAGQGGGEQCQSPGAVANQDLTCPVGFIPHLFCILQHSLFQCIGNVPVAVQCTTYGHVRDSQILCNFFLCNTHASSISAGILSIFS